MIRLIMRFVKSLLVYLYRKIYIPYKKGFIWFVFKYFFLIRKKDYNSLRASGFDNIKTYEFMTWRIGHESDGAHRRYYLADYNGVRCFVKIAKGDLTVLNEIYVQSKIRYLGWDFTPECVFLKKELYKDTHILAVKYINDLKPLCGQGWDFNIESFCRQILNILNKLKDAGLVHADIHVGNLAKDSDGKVYLLDFGISKFTGDAPTVDYDQREGTFFIVEDNLKIYDDAFSVIEMINNQIGIANCKQTPYYDEIVNLYGRLYFTVPTRRTGTRFSVSTDSLAKLNMIKYEKKM